MARATKKYSFKSVGIKPEERPDFLFEENVVPIGIKTPISFADNLPSVFKMHTDLRESIRDNLKNLVATNHGERILIPDFGANLQELAMDIGTEQGDQEIMSRIQTAVNKFMPAISLSGYEPIRKLNEDGSISRLSMIISFAVPLLGARDVSLEIVMFQGGG